MDVEKHFWYEKVAFVVIVIIISLSLSNRACYWIEIFETKNGTYFFFIITMSIALLS